MFDAEYRMGSPQEQKKDPLADILDPLADRIGWDSPRNWASEGESGSWTYTYPKKEFLDLFDMLWVFCFVTMAFIMVKSAVAGDLASAVYLIIYLLMLLIYEIYFLAERLNKVVLFTSAVIDWGMKSKLKHYLKVGAASAFIYIVLSVVLSYGQAIVMGGMIPLQSVTGLLGVFSNSVSVPMAEESAFRGVISPYLAESLGVVPSILLSMVISGVFHWQVFNATPQFILLSGLYGLIQGYVVLKEKAITPCVISHIIVNTLAVVLAAVGG